MSERRGDSEKRGNGDKWANSATRPGGGKRADSATRPGSTDHPKRDKRADHIVIIGFMGSGKSSVARRLARYEKMSSIDMDTYIERELGMSIPQFFETQGEAAFRTREYDFLCSMLTRLRSILSCGGGVIVRDESRELVKQLGTVVYLVVDAEEAVSRISRPQTRPLLQGPTPPAEILASRLRYYEDAADITVDTRGKTINQVVAKVQRALRNAGKL